MIFVGDRGAEHSYETIAGDLADDTLDALHLRAQKVEEPIDYFMQHLWIERQCCEALHASSEDGYLLAFPFRGTQGGLGDVGQGLGSVGGNVHRLVG
jgi:hypothetical protein